jgi:tRNA(Ile)-lysidine synthase
MPAGAVGPARRRITQTSLARPPAVARVLERVTVTARRDGMFQPDSKVLVAVSGGPDSMCLLHSLARLRRLFRLSLTCFHFDHGLREGSADDAEYVRRHAKKLGVPFVLRQARSKPARGDSIEAWARSERYRAMLTVLEEVEGSAAALGHTADDQAETVLLALLRGGGLEAVAGMRPVSRPFVRPLLGVARQETEAFCRSLHLRPRRDPMNEDPTFLRVAIRTLVIPAVEEGVGRAVRATLARTAALLARDAAFLQDLATSAAASVVDSDGEDRLLRAGLLADLPVALSSRIVHREILSLGQLPAAAHVDAVLALAAAGPGKAVILPGGLRARREKVYVRLSAALPRRHVPEDAAGGTHRTANG